MNGLEERLRSELERATEWVLPAPDPMGRLLRRRRRRQWLRRATLSIVSVAAVALAGGTVATVGSPRPSPPLPAPSYLASPPPPDRGTPITPLIRQLIGSPTRGNLASDTALVDDLTGKLREHRSYWGLTSTLTHVKVMLLADVGIERIYAAAFYSDTQAVFVEASGYPDTPTDQLAEGEFGSAALPATPFALLGGGSQPIGKPSYLYQIALAPAGCTIATAGRFRLSAGQAVADWTDLGTDYVARDGSQPSLWWRFTCHGVVQKTYTGAFDGAPKQRTPTVTERGRADPGSVARAFRDWQGLPGLPVTKYRALWGGTPPGGTRKVVVVAGETSGGLEVNAVAAGDGTGSTVSSAVAGGPTGNGDTSPAALRWDGVGTGVAASADLVVVRLPDDKDPAVLSDRLLILGPRGATSATVTGGVTATVPLTDGVGVVTAKAPATIDVRAGGATARLAEPDGAAMLAFGLRVDTY